MSMTSFSVFIFSFSINIIKCRNDLQTMFYDIRSITAIDKRNICAFEKCKDFNAFLTLALSAIASSQIFVSSSFYKRDAWT